jgi:hypothetical protein
MRTTRSGSTMFGGRAACLGGGMPIDGALWEEMLRFPFAGRNGDILAQEFHAGNSARSARASVR